MKKENRRLAQQRRAEERKNWSSKGRSKNFSPIFCLLSASWSLPASSSGTESGSLLRQRLLPRSPLQTPQMQPTAAPQTQLKTRLKTQLETQLTAVQIPKTQLPRIPILPIQLKAPATPQILLLPCRTEIPSISTMSALLTVWNLKAEAPEEPVPLWSLAPVTTSMILRNSSSAPIPEIRWTSTSPSLKIMERKS